MNKIINAVTGMSIASDERQHQLVDPNNIDNTLRITRKVGPKLVNGSEVTNVRGEYILNTVAPVASCSSTQCAGKETVSVRLSFSGSSGNYDVTNAMLTALAESIPALIESKATRGLPAQANTAFKVVNVTVE